jgi:DNA-binding transcriptional ArsR family regulator
MLSGVPVTITRSDVFVAIAHPIRRQILDDLATGERPVNSLAAPHGVSRPAVSQHLRVLLDSGLVTERRDGRERRYSLVPRRLAEVRDWVATYDRFWTAKMKALEAYLEETHASDSD